MEKSIREKFRLVVVLSQVLNLPLIVFTFLTTYAVIESSNYSFLPVSIVNVFFRSVLIGCLSSLIYSSIYVYLKSSLSPNVLKSSIAYTIILWLLRYGVVTFAGFVGSGSSVVGVFTEIIMQLIFFFIVSLVLSLVSSRLVKFSKV